MENASAPMLSQHLLEEADHFIFYPVRSRRDRARVAAQKTLDAAMRRFMDWRRTFVPREHKSVVDFWSSARLLNQAYCRELLGAIPDVVDRTLRLRSVTLSGISDAESLACLREAANSYVMGLPLATVALSRAAIERALKLACAKRFGQSVINAATLDELIERFAPQVVSKSACVLADSVRRKGNEVLHPKGSRPSLLTALGVLESARAVVYELNR